MKIKSTVRETIFFDDIKPTSKIKKWYKKLCGLEVKRVLIPNDNYFYIIDKLLKNGKTTAKKSIIRNEN